MDSFFGIGFPELVFILIIAGLVMGPQRIRQVARFLGRFIAQVQGLSRQFTQQLNSELDALDNDDVRGAMDELKSLRSQVTDLQSQMRSLPAEFTGEGKKAVKEGKAVMSGKGSESPAGRQTSRNGNASGNNSADSEPAAPAKDLSLPQPIEVPDDPE